MAWLVFGLRWLIWWLSRLRRGRPAPWISFLIESPLATLDAPRAPLWQRLLVRRPRPASLGELRRQLGTAAADPRVRGVVVHLRPISLSAAGQQALTALLGEVRAAGKQVVCWSSGYSASTYPVACAADQVLLQPGGSLGPLGVGRGYLFLAGALSRLGLKAEVVQVSPFKTAGDLLTRTEMTPEAREMAGWLADAAFGDLVQAVAARAGLDEISARALIDSSPHTDERALAAGAVDGVLREEELPSRLGGEVRSFAASARRLRRPHPVRPGRFVGLIQVEGMIVDGRSRRPPVGPPLPLPLGGEWAGDLTVAEQARKLAAAKRCAAAVLWVDSGGGSATASEAMASALEALAARKPLVAAMGAVAASGGYYVTTPARRVYAQPGTLTGSIGVLAGKLVTGGLLDRLLFHREVVARGARATMDSPDRGWTSEERELVEAGIERSYRLFVSRVASARHRTPEAIHEVAGGRVWTGRQALERGLVDALGGLDEAVSEARRLAGLRPDAPLRAARGGRAELPPLAAASVLAPLQHARETIGALNRARVWWLCPWLVSDSG